MDLMQRRLEAIGRRAAREQDDQARLSAPLSTDERLAGIHRREGARTAAASARGRWGLSLAVAACVALVVIWRLVPSPRKISYESAGVAGVVGEWVGNDDAEVPLGFSDGSAVIVRAGARARVTELRDDGAGLLVERGALHVRVVHRDSTRWVVSSGPFEVHVIGTEFELGWDSEAEALTVAMTEGRVRVASRCPDVPTQVVDAPRTVRLSCAAPIASERPVPVGSAPAVVAQEPGPGPTASATGTPSAKAAPSATSPTWRALLQDGKRREAFAAIAETIDAVLGQASGSELVELGSAARLAGDPAAATRFYQKARSAFPGSDAAALAAYQLGRMAFDGRSAWAEAERWFGVYLSEQPGGALAPEALGRSMEAAHRGGNEARAQSLAERYLKSYPTGAHAQLARSISEGESE